MVTLVDKIGSKLAFFPPDPPSYKVEQHGDGAREDGLKKVHRAQVVRVPSPRSKGNIVGVFLPAPGADKVRFTLLHSHGNAVDVGEMLPLYEELAALLRCNIFAYDYTGYGRSDGTPSAAATLGDITAAFDCLLTQYDKQPQDIVLYGQSVGSGPTSFLAARQHQVAGVVLHSPFMSGMRVLNPTWTHWPGWLDIFPNYKWVPRIQSPVLVLHGTQDEVIDISHGKKLHSLCKRPAEPLWAAGCNHQNLEGSPEYLKRVRAFLGTCFGDDYKRHVGLLK
ncbi:hypothetical protein N2152v2_001717 [Parachlorella kessleri]